MRTDIYLDHDKKTSLSFFQALQILGEIMAHEEYESLLSRLAEVSGKLSEVTTPRVSDLLLFFEDPSLGAYFQIALSNQNVEILWRNFSVLDEERLNPEHPLTIGITVCFHKRTGILKLNNVEIWFGNVNDYDLPAYEAILKRPLLKFEVENEEFEESEPDEGEVWEPLTPPEEAPEETAGFESLTPVFLLRYLYQSFMLTVQTIEAIFNGTSGKIRSFSEPVPKAERVSWLLSKELDLFSRAQIETPFTYSVMFDVAHLSVGADGETPLIERELKLPNGPLSLPIKPELWIEDFPLNGLENLTKSTRLPWTTRYE